MRFELLMKTFHVAVCVDWISDVPALLSFAFHAEASKSQSKNDGV